MAARGTLSDEQTLGDEQMSEPEVVAPGRVDWRSAQTGLRQAAPQGLAIGRLWPLGILLLAPGIAALSVLIVAGLLGFFIAWLSAVGFLFTATLLSDFARAFWRYAHPPVGAVKEQTAG